MVDLVASNDVADPMAHKKPNLPTKICPVCHRPFTWRKKWARDWDSVKYCSERCRREAPRPATEAHARG